MDRVTTIYALIDPRNNECRYVGKTVNVERRYSNHCTDSLKEFTHKANWIKSLLPLRPGLIELETVSPENESECEIWWISYMKSLGARLTNLTLGGEGASGFKHDDETRFRMSELAKLRPSPRKGTKLAHEQIAASSIRMKLIMSNPEIRAKVSKTHRGITHSKEDCQRQSERMKKFWNTPEGKVKKEASFTEECRAKMSVSASKRERQQRSEETRNKISKTRKSRVYVISDEERERRSDYAKNNPVHKETRIKMASTLKITLAEKKAAKVIEFFKICIPENCVGVFED